jgi:hypothetical protein
MSGDCSRYCDYSQRLFPISGVARWNIIYIYIYICFSLLFDIMLTIRRRANSCDVSMCLIGVVWVLLTEGNWDHKMKRNHFLCEVTDGFTTLFVKVCKSKAKGDE